MRRWLPRAQVAAGLLGAAMAGPASCALPSAWPETQGVAVACGKAQPVKPQGGASIRSVVPPAIWVNVNCESTALGLAPAPAAQSGVPPNAASGATSGTAPGTVPGVVPVVPPAVPGLSSASADESKAASAAAFGNERRDGPILVSLLVATLLTVAGLGLLATALGWPATDASEARADSEPGYPAAPAEGLTFRRHWGSFGAESTGWSMSSRLAKLLAGLGLIGAAAMLLLLLLSVTDPLRKLDKAAASPTVAPAKSALVPAVS